MSNTILLEQIKEATSTLNKKISDNEPLHPRVSLYRMCEIVHHPEYYTKIMDDIQNAVNNDPTLTNYIYWNPTNNDIIIDKKGIEKFFIILISYFNADDICALTNYLTELESKNILS